MWGYRQSCLKGVYKQLYNLAIPDTKWGDYNLDLDYENNHI